MSRTSLTSADSASDDTNLTIPDDFADVVREIDAAVKRARRKESVQFSRRLVEDRGDGSDSPLAVLLRGNPGRGGRSGEMRLKLYLMLAMMATRAPHKLDPRPAYRYAQLIGLPDPRGGGARRVAQALTWLDGNGFIMREAVRRGVPPGITVNYMRSASESVYVSVPISLWRRGWITCLPGRALAILILLRWETRGKERSTSLTGRRKAEIGLSADTWARGVRDLDGFRLVSAYEIVDSAGFQQARRRMEYKLDMAALDTDPRVLVTRTGAVASAPR